ncbi:hypothetical protein [Nocardioides ferulae]|nr:hypothetical protein [Nocardioides ferulae]
MLENTNPFLASELAFRGDRIRQGVARKRRRPRRLVRRGVGANTPRSLDG